jgi:hypothetical protein
MWNSAIRTAIQRNPESKFKLVEIAYLSLKEYGLHTHYILSACEVLHARPSRRSGEGESGRQEDAGNPRSG